MDGVPFTLTAVEGRLSRDASAGAATDSGLLCFDALAPGTYRLRGTDTVWGHAEADHVDAQGISSSKPVGRSLSGCSSVTRMQPRNVVIGERETADKPPSQAHFGPIDA